ncbi:MAG: peptide ABC transporter substrate-binding protein [Patescibacteria group bacterium]
MKRFFEKLRAMLQRIFFWHGAKSSEEFTPSIAHDHELVLQVAEPAVVPRWKQLRYVGLVLNFRERRIALIALILFLIAGGSVAWMLMRNHLIHVPAAGGKITEAIVGSPKAINPLYAVANDPDADLTALVFSGLFRHASGTNVVPDLASKYEWSADGKQLSVTIRDGVQFHDGTPLTADDVVFTLRSAKDPAWRSPYASALRDVNIDESNSQTVVLTLTRPNAFLLDTLTIGILPAHIWQDVPPQNALLANANTSPIGSGPFSVRSLQHTANGNILSYVLDRFDAYYGIKPFIRQIELRFFPDRLSSEDALRSGQVDQLAFETGASSDKFTKSSQFTVSSLELPQLTLAFFNVEDPLLKDASVRQALAMAVDRNKIVADQGNYAHPLYGPYPFISSDESTASPEERLDAARAMLEKDGWVAPTSGGIRARKSSSTSTQGEPLSLHITVPDVPELTSVADALKRDWSLLGADVIVTTVPSGDLLAKISELHSKQILIWNVLLSPTQDISPMWISDAASGSGLNLSNLKNRDVDTALNTVKAATNPQALADAQRATAKAILAQTPAVFLMQPSYGYVRSSRVMGARQDMQIASPSDRFDDVQNWYVKMGWRLK